MGFGELLLQRPLRKTDGGKLAMLLARHGIDLVVDVGANVGQTGARLRKLGYAGRIVSIEPLQSAHNMLKRNAATDPTWTVLPRMALGATVGTVTMFSAEASDLSSVTAPRGDLTVALPKARTIGTEVVSLERLDGIWPDIAEAAERPMLKLDTQGSELSIIEGAIGCFEEIGRSHV